MEHASGHALSGVQLIACGLVLLVAPQGGAYDGLYWDLPPADDTGWLASLNRLLGFLVMFAGLALVFGWSAFGLADFLPF